MQIKRNIIAVIIAAIIITTTGVGATEEKKVVTVESNQIYETKFPYMWNRDYFKIKSITWFDPYSMPRLLLSSYQFSVKPEPRYGVDFTHIREVFPNRPFVKKVLTEEMEDYLNEVEAESGIPGAVMIAQAIWEVGWELYTPKGGGRDSRNLFNIKNCNGDYVVMAGSRWQCYDSYKDSIDGYIKLITTQPIYANAYQHIKNGGDIETYYRMLGDAGYYEASKDSYTSNCMSIIRTNHLIAKEF